MIDNDYFVEFKFLVIFIHMIALYIFLIIKFD
jgi:hypothetical protein